MRIDSTATPQLSANLEARRVSCTEAKSQSVPNLLLDNFFDLSGNLLALGDQALELASTNDMAKCGLSALDQSHAHVGNTESGLAVNRNERQ